MTHPVRKIKQWIAQQKLGHENIWLLAPHRNWYRDIWLFVISGILLWSSWTGQSTANSGKRTAVEGKRTAQQAKVLAEQNAMLTLEIQQERYNSVFNDCWRQNLRHKNTIAALNHVLVYYKHHLPPGQTQADLKRNIKSNILLINAIVPRANCATLAGNDIKSPHSKHHSARIRVHPAK